MRTSPSSSASKLRPLQAPGLNQQQPLPPDESVELKPLDFTALPLGGTEKTFLNRDLSRSCRASGPWGVLLCSALGGDCQDIYLYEDTRADSRTLSTPLLLLLRGGICLSTLQLLCPMCAARMGVGVEGVHTARVVNISFCFFVMLGLDPSAMGMLGKPFTTNIYP